MAVDDSYTKVLLHMNGADASTTFTDESGKTWTARGSAQIDTAQYKFGGASGLFDGTGDYIDTPSNVDFSFGTGDWTIDFWARFNALPTSNQQFAYFSTYSVSETQNFMKLALINNAGVSYYYQFQAVSGGANIVLLNNKTTTVVTDTWYHIAVRRYGNLYAIYQNGTLVGTEDTISSVTMPTNSSPFVIGYNGGSSYYLNGWVDEFRLSKGVARWTSNFTPPTAPYPSMMFGSGMWFM